ncbi:predicted protein [Naegleria gruberi]|uniref:Predicted protein n=1 Tax=Naegleria gruberi TaxID=5762 RepID=D2VH94_NAEGR|nr:uncharacterized protein NAEGRDRAFT_68134 [Naegleria gruberi]EFC43760.1 predicted protein [Naegleria gruberi]|eukprot:XP_002676504.1 predicted protein [Naegleria gruberi strain NEG-M]
MSTSVTITSNPTTTSTTQQPIRKRSTASRDGSGGIEVNTCCGSVSMSNTKCLVVVVLLLNIIAFCVLLALLIDIYIGKVNQNLESITKRGDALLYSEILSCSSRMAASSSNENITKFFLDRYDEYHPKYMALMNEIINLVPASAVGQIQSETNEANNITRDESVVMEEEAISLVKAGEKDDALEILDGSEYASEKEDYDSDLKGYTDYIRTEELKKDAQTNDRTLACLILICCLMALVLPVVVISLVASFSREKQERAKLERAKAIVLNDTMADPKLKELFKKHCEQEFSMENFLLLERIAEYKSLCEKSFDIQVFLYDSSSDEVSTNSGNTTKTSVSTSTSNSYSKDPSKKPSGYNEKDLELVEKQKRDLAQNVFDQFLNINGIMPVNVNKKIADDILLEIQTASNSFQNLTSPTDMELGSIGANTILLSDSLFDVLENEAQIVMLDTHTRFKQSLAFQKKMKIDSIKQKMNNNKKK